MQVVDANIRARRVRRCKIRVFCLCSLMKTVKRTRTMHMPVTLPPPFPRQLLPMPLFYAVTFLSKSTGRHPTARDVHCERGLIVMHAMIILLVKHTDWYLSKRLNGSSWLIERERWPLGAGCLLYIVIVRNFVSPPKWPLLRNRNRIPHSGLCTPPISCRVRCDCRQRSVSSTTIDGHCYKVNLG